MLNLEEVLLELNNFEKSLPVAADGNQLPPLLEDYLKFVAKTGNTHFPWTKIKPVFRFKLENVISDFHQSSPMDDIPPMPNVDQFQFSAVKDKVFEQLDCFSGIPFTVQRLCELLTAPKKHYRRADKFMRALEKNMLIVSTVDPITAVHKERVIVNGNDHEEEISEDKEENIQNGDAPSNGDTSMDQASPPSETAEQQPTSQPQVVPSASDPAPDATDEAMDIDNECTSTDIRLTSEDDHPPSEKKQRTDSESTIDSDEVVSPPPISEVESTTKEGAKESKGESKEESKDALKNDEEVEGEMSTEDDPKDEMRDDEELEGEASTEDESKELEVTPPLTTSLTDDMAAVSTSEQKDEEQPVVAVESKPVAQELQSVPAEESPQKEEKAAPSNEVSPKEASPEEGSTVVEAPAPSTQDETPEKKVEEVAPAEEAQPQDATVDSSSAVETTSSEDKTPSVAAGESSSTEKKSEVEAPSST